MPDIFICKEPVIPLKSKALPCTSKARGIKRLHKDNDNWQIKKYKYCNSNIKRKATSLLHHLSLKEVEFFSLKNLIVRATADGIIIARARIVDRALAWGRFLSIKVL